MRSRLLCRSNVHFKRGSRPPTVHISPLLIAYYKCNAETSGRVAVARALKIKIHQRDVKREYSKKKVEGEEEEKKEDTGASTRKPRLA